MVHLVPKLYLHTSSITLMQFGTVMPMYILPDCIHHEWELCTFQCVEILYLDGNQREMYVSDVIDAGAVFLLTQNQADDENCENCNLTVNHCLNL